MMHLLLNGLAASAGGGLTYLRNVIPQLAIRSDVRTTAIVGPRMRSEFGDLSNVSFLEVDELDKAPRRFWWEQRDLAEVIRRSRADVLISTGNFALRKSPVPQILLSRNSLYTSSDFLRDVRARHDYGLWLDTRVKGILAKKSIQWADCTVAPSQAFAEDLSRWAGREVISIHHGFDRDLFFRDQTPLNAEAQQKLDGAKDSLRILFVSHYNYYRNFETLLRAIPLFRDRLRRRVKLILTCRLQSEHNPGSYHAQGASDLVGRMAIADQVVELGTVPYESLHHVYGACDIYVTPAYTESFAHPLVEAMACGLPIVASDLAVHREICGNAAVYFPRFSADELADQVVRTAESVAVAEELRDSGKQRSQDFSWSDHAGDLIAIARKLGHSPVGPDSAA